MIETSEKIDVYGPYKVADLSPMMLQWHEIKSSCPDALLLFRLGDFYEAFYDDAEILANACSVTLTKRQDVPMAGVPQHMLPTYLDRLIQKGIMVSIAEQIEDPKSAKGIVKRALTRVESPATYAGFVEQKVTRKNYFASICQLKTHFGLALIDLSTQNATVFELENQSSLLDILIQKQPRELLIDSKFEERGSAILEEIQRNFSLRITRARSHYFQHDNAVRFLLDHFGILQLDGLGLNGKIATINATAALLSYLKDHQQNIEPIRVLQIETLTDHLLIDHRTDRHLHISSSLLSFLDTTVTGMGARLFKEVLERPLIESSGIIDRQNRTQALMKKPLIVAEISKILERVHDLERILYRLHFCAASTKELLLIHSSLKAVERLVPLFVHFKCDESKKLIDALPDFSSLVHLLDNELEIPSVSGPSDRIFKKGVHPQIDALRDFSMKGDQWLIDYQERLKLELDIKTLKVSFTRAFGYYIEVSRAQSNKIPESFIRRQTLVQQERYITKELQEFEEKCLFAEDTLKKLEENALRSLIERVLKELPLLKRVAEGVAWIDVYTAFVRIAQKEGYVCPKILHHGPFVIEEGRHPLVETLMPYKSFIPNSLCLNETNRLALITGPNMGGKSTYIRQSALIILMAQMGCFVPAKRVELVPFDRIFSRIGAHDDLYRGQSTFMVEMAETAEILNNLTYRSFVILDEIGRGTSTYDGISIAWSVLEFLAQSVKKPKTLFATHYSELTGCMDEIDGVFNLKVLVKESLSGILFSYKLVEGSTDKSYGIHVAKLAGLPPQIISRAMDILKTYEKQRPTKPTQKGYSLKEQIVIF